MEWKSTWSERRSQAVGALLEAGREEGLIPCGLGSQGYPRSGGNPCPLYGHEMDDTITPKEADLWHLCQDG